MSSSVKKGSNRIEWQFDNILKSGRYTLDVELSSAESGVIDWWSDAVQFQVVKSIATPHLVQPEISFKAKK